MASPGAEARATKLRKLNQLLSQATHTSTDGPSKSREQITFRKTSCEKNQSHPVNTNTGFLDANAGGFNREHEALQRIECRAFRPGAELNVDSGDGDCPDTRHQTAKECASDEFAGGHEAAYTSRQGQLHISETPIQNGTSAATRINDCSGTPERWRVGALAQYEDDGVFDGVEDDDIMLATQLLLSHFPARKAPDGCPPFALLTQLKVCGVFCFC